METLHTYTHVCMQCVLYVLTVLYVCSVCVVCVECVVCVCMHALMHINTFTNFDTVSLLFSQVPLFTV